MSIYVFTGPTINESSARQWLDANYLPPVSQGDIVSLMRFKPTAIGIIDGYFDSVPAVWHKEILFAIDQGVHVVGAASMGALRAAELHPFGMKGVGRIFEWYRDGVIDADDAVALHHAPVEYQFKPHSEPLVNIRATLLAARQAAIISDESFDVLMAATRNTVYWDRSYRRLLTDAADLGITEAEISALRQFVAHNAIDLKQRDAIAMLTYLAEGEFQTSESTFDFQDTIFFSGLFGRDRKIYDRDDVSITIDELIEYARLDQDFNATRRRALHGEIALTLARERNILPDEVSRARVLRQIGISESTMTDTEWLQRNGLEVDELSRWIEELATIEKVQSTYLGLMSNVILRRQLLSDGILAQMLDEALNQKAIRANTPMQRMADGKLIELHFSAIGRPVPEDIHAYAAELGFTSYAHFLLALEKRFGGNSVE